MAIWLVNITCDSLKLKGSLFSTPPAEFQRTPYPRQIDPTPNGNDLGHYTIKIRYHRFDARDDLCQWLSTCKNAPEIVLRIRKIKFKFWAKSGLNLKLRHRKAQKMILSERSGDRYGRAGDRCRIRESWHVRLGHAKNNSKEHSQRFSFKFPTQYLLILKTNYWEMTIQLKLCVLYSHKACLFNQYERAFFNLT